LGGGLFRPDRRSAKVIVANPTMINAYKAGVPGNGQPFPDGSKIAKLQWKPRRARRLLRRMCLTYFRL
jgi:hypothetical protein